jgi:hypothetical protein
MIEQILVECIHCIPKRANAFEIGIMLLICSELKVEGTRLPTADVCSVEKLSWKVSWSLQCLYNAINTILVMYIAGCENICRIQQTSVCLSGSQD